MNIPDFIPADAWKGYDDMRKKLRKPMTDRAMELRIKDLQAFHDAGQDVGAILDQSTANGWTDLYPLKDKRGAQRQSSDVAFNRSRLGKFGRATANNALDWLEGK